VPDEVRTITLDHNGEDAPGDLVVEIENMQMVSLFD
jgi:hypothetical protein